MSKKINRIIAGTLSMMLVGQVMMSRLCHLVCIKKGNNARKCVLFQ